MKKATITVFMTIFLLVCLLFQAGCSGSNAPGTNAKTDMAIAKSALQNAKQTSNPEYRVKCLRTAYILAENLKTHWPDSEMVPTFLKKHGAELKRIPEQVYTLSMQTRDMDSFKWAVARSNRNDLLQYSELLKVWEMGKQWRDYYISEYPEQTLSIFMSEAVNDHCIRFFNQYIGDFKASAYRLEFPLEKTEFNIRFCHFFSDLIETAIKNEDVERIDFLITHMPSNESTTPQIDLKTKDTMRAVGDYVCHKLKNEALACKLVDLGYDMNRVDFSKSGFGDDFIQVLNANPEHTITHVLKLNEWHGNPSAEETRFLLSLPDPLLRLLHKLHIIEAIRVSIKSVNNDDVLRLIKAREEIDPPTTYDYHQLLGWSLEYNNHAVFEHIKTKCAEINIYLLNLDQLARDWDLFRLYAPQILKKIYGTMNTLPKKDGTTLGRIRDLMKSHNPKAVLYVVKNYNLRGDRWTEMTGGQTLLMDVCEGGNLEAAKYLIENKGADVHAHTDYTEAKTTVFGRARAKEGKLTPIFFAANSGNSKLIEYLVSKGAQVNDRSCFGATPLMHAVSNERLEATKTLISLGAHIHLAIHENLNPSDLAEMGVYPEISTAYRRAQKTGNKEILAVLKKAGARP